jgi:hypothetical protein
MAKFWKNLSRNQQIVVAIITSFTAIIVAFIGAGVFKLSPNPSCQVNASEITIEKKVIEVNQTTKVSIRVALLHEWRNMVSLGYDNKACSNQQCR